MNFFLIYMYLLVFLAGVDINWFLRRLSCQHAKLVDIQSQCHKISFKIQSSYYFIVWPYELENNHYRKHSYLIFEYKVLLVRGSSILKH